MKRVYYSLNEPPMHNGIACTKYGFCLCFLLLLTPFLHSQLPVAERESYLLMNQLNDDNGLPQNSIIAQYIDTTSGMLWLATYSGLIRYNGITPRIYLPDSSNKLETHQMVCFFKTRDGKAFGMNTNMQLITIDGQDFNVNNDFIPIYKKNKGFIWFRGILDSLNQIEKLGRLNVERRAYYEQQQNWIQNNYNFYVTAMPGNRLAAVSRMGKMLVYKDSRITDSQSIANPKFTQVVYRNGYLYALDPQLRGACFRVDQQTVAAVPCTFSAELESLRRKQYAEPKILYSELNDQLFWLIDSTVYLLQLNKGNVSVEKSFSLSAVPRNAISLSWYRKHQMLFVGTSTDGLLVYRKNHFVQLYTTYPGANINSNYAQQLLPGDQLRTNRGVVYDLPSRKPVQHLQKNFYIWSAYSMDRSGTLYQHNDDTVFALAPGTTAYRVLYINERLPDMHHNIIKFALYDTVRDRLWIMETRRWGYLQNGEYHSVVPYQQQDLPMPLSFTSNGNTIVLGTTLGVVVLDVNTRHWELLPKTGNREVRFVRFDTDPRYCWVGGYSYGYGLLDMKSREVRLFPEDPLQYLKNVHALVEDSSGHIWATTNKGLFRFSKKEMLEYVAGNSNHLYYDYFNRQDGLHTNEFNGGHQPIYNWWKGQLLLSSINGITLFDPGKVAPYYLDEPLYIDHAQTRGRPSIESSGNEAWRFSASERNIKWIINKACWDNPYSLGLAYKLDNETEWRPLHQLPAAIELESLNAGYHSLQIRNYAALGSNLYITKDIEFYVAQFWYEQLWVHLCLAILGASLLILVVRWQTKKLSLRNQELAKKINERTKSLEASKEDLESTNQLLIKSNSFKTKLISILMHDIATPAAGIQNVTELLYENSDKLDMGVRLQTIKEINNTAGKLTKLSKQLVLWTRIQKNISNLNKILLKLHAMVDDQEKTMEEELADKENILRNHVPFELGIVTDPDILKLLLQNLLSNANKFTENGTIEVGAFKDAQSVTFFVKDNGIGMPEEIRKQLEQEQAVPSQPDTRKEKSWGWGLGYQVIFDLLLLMHGTINIESKEGKGTTVTITIPQGEDGKTVSR